MNENPIVSVIVPVHNAGRHLLPCLQSLAVQTLRSIEFVLVLDCPTDGSDRVAERFAEKDSRFRLVRNAQNLHIGLSRNAGLEVAKGKWIGFADHDDLVEPQLWESLLLCAEANDAEVVLCAFDQRSASASGAYLLPECDACDLRENVLRALIGGEYAQVGTTSFRNVNSVWTELISRDLIDRHHLRFPDNRQCSYEDALFNIGVFANANRAAYLPQVLYHHLIHENNAFARYEYRSYTHMLRYTQLLTECLETCGLCDRYAPETRACVVRRLYTSMYNELKFNGLKSLPHFFRVIKTDVSVGALLHRQKVSGLRLTQQIFKWLVWG
ncbi:MAG: glycosyltransferase [Paludibacteraceae bacterium]|nr:glycosyltransferase [Paludibacteraceae bacterium]